MDFSDLAPFYADFGVAVTHTPQAGAPVTDRGIFDAPGMAMVGGEMIGTDYSVRYPAVTFNVVRGDSFTINGGTYQARENPQPATFDGLDLVVPLRKVS
ncbi:hypothetical protein [Thiobacillus sp. 65-1402]|uniref:head-tail joining protein n=1 Tax=Thiobacillus sp. 65-1402 TaxID=1895861 RepID=UPI0009674608|nr:hypothetical protein [Thiobacillus sp. 65-1402]OJW77981.1 MAG: hypothetical protein BGO62_10440 [Thiobacillus sp. 65-1402]